MQYVDIMTSKWNMQITPPVLSAFKSASFVQYMLSNHVDSVIHSTQDWCGDSIKDPR